MQLGKVSFAVAIWLALAAVVIPPIAWAQAPSDDVLSRDAVLRDPDIPALGNPEGDITIVEYFDYQCPYCKKTAPELAQVVAEDGKVKLVLKDWPIFGPASTYAARMTLAAKYQDKYEAAHDALIAAKAKLTEAAVDDLLGKAGVDVTRAAADRDTHAAEIDALLGPERRAGPRLRLPGDARLHHWHLPRARRAEHGRLQARDRRCEEGGGEVVAPN